MLKNFHPVSNLPYLSKLIERVAARRLLDHMTLNNLHELYQSSYKQFHSVETALLRVQSDILSALDSKKCVLLIMLDLSAAFDTIDHKTLISRLKSEIGVAGKALSWFNSYISGRKQAVLINGATSKLWELLFGVPQGSVLGPILFIIYTGPLGRILRRMGVNFHFYADDTQIYVSFDIDGADAAVKKVEEVIALIRKWMSENFLCLNDDKTEVILLGSKAAHQKLSIPHINVGNDNITPAKDARNIGYIFDHVMNCKKQVSSTCKAAWYHLRNVGRVREFLDKKSTEQLIHAFVSSKLDINNALLYGLPETLLRKLQTVQNGAARLVMKLPKHCHITPTLAELHWLPVKKRINYKILLTVFKALHNQAPSYISEMLRSKEDSCHSLRSNVKNLLVIPRSNSVQYGDRNFRNVAPILWNKLPQDMRNCDDLNNFKRSLKTLLFNEAFN